MRAKVFGSIETLSREISAPMRLLPVGEGDFSTPLRFGRNDTEAGECLRQFVPCRPMIKRLSPNCLTIGGGEINHFFTAPPSRRPVFMTDYLKSARYRDSSPVAWGRREGRSHNAGSFLRKQLGEALRNTEELSKDLTLLSSVAYGATPFLRKGAPALRHAAIVTQVPIP